MDELRDFRCGSCEAEFATQRELDDHRRTAHLAYDPGRGLRCPTCGESFDTRAALDEHVREAHEVPIGKPAVEVGDREP